MSNNIITTGDRWFNYVRAQKATRLTRRHLAATKDTAKRARKAGGK
jgi:hypothetical protein